MQARLPLADCCLGCQPIREGFTSSPMDATPENLKPPEKIYWKMITLFCYRLIYFDIHPYSSFFTTRNATSWPLCYYSISIFSLCEKFRGLTSQAGGRRGRLESSKTNTTKTLVSCNRFHRLLSLSIS